MVFDHNQQSYEIWVNHKFVAYIPDEFAINLFKQRLIQLAELPKIDATQLKPAIVDGIPSVMIGNQFLFGVSQHTSRQLNLSADLLAIEWVNNLRIALKAPPLSLAELQMEMYGLVPSDVRFSGIASWYGDDFDGKLTANGEIYHQKEFTVAHRSLPFNTYLLVRNLLNGSSVIVRVNDRGPYITPRSLDLSTQAAISIRSEITGVIPYEAIILKPNLHKKSFLPKNERPVDDKFVDFN
jgi:rare lipoprotein A